MTKLYKILSTLLTIPVAFSSTLVLAQDSSVSASLNETATTSSLSVNAQAVDNTDATTNLNDPDNGVNNNLGSAGTQEIVSSGDTITVKYKYYNNTQNDQTAYVTMFIAPSITAAANKLASSQAFDVVSISEEYDMQFTPPSEVAPTTSSKTREIKVADASFVGIDNNIRMVLTPGSQEGCIKTNNVKGCNWDIQNQNVWDPETFSCLSQGDNKCEGNGTDEFKTENTNMLKAQTGGMYTIVLKPKADLMTENYYFPLSMETVQPSLRDAIINPLSENITTQGTNSGPKERLLTSPEIPGLTVSCINAYAGTSDAICKFELPDYRLLPPTFKMGIGDVTPAGKCTANKKAVTCTNVPVVNKVGKEKIYGQIGTEEKVDTGETADVIAKPKEPLKAGEMLNLACEDAVVNTFTTCKFEMPANKYLPETFSISISDGARNKECRAVEQKVTCTKVATGSVVGKMPIWEWFGETKSDTKKTANVLPASAPVAETGSAMEVLAFGSIVALLVGAGWYFLKGTNNKNALEVNSID